MAMGLVGIVSPAKVTEREIRQSPEYRAAVAAITGTREGPVYPSAREGADSLQRPAYCRADVEADEAAMKAEAERIGNGGSSIPPGLRERSDAIQEKILAYGLALGDTGSHR